MGSTPSHPIIDFNGASLGKHNNILLPPEAFPLPPPAQRGIYAGNKYVEGNPVPYRWPRNFPAEVDRWRGRGKRGGRRKVGGKYVDKGVGGGMGMGVGGVPVVPVPVQVPVYYDARGVKGMSAPNLYRVRGKGRQVMQPQVGVQPQMVPVPAVGQAGGMPYGYAYPPHPPPVPRHQSEDHIASLPRPVVPQNQNQTQRHNPGIPDIPYGARVARSTSPARRVSAQNRTQPRVPLSGNEWIEGPNPWLDACTCTTNCRCRKGARVLYRAEGREGDRRKGEIRYVVRDGVGRDCGDHDYGRCNKEEDGGSDGNGRKGKKKKKEGSEKTSEVGKMRKEMEGLRREVEKMRVGGIGGVPSGIDPRYEFWTPPRGMGHHDALNGLEDQLGPSPFPMPHRRNLTRRPPRPRHRVPDLSDDMDFPTEDHFFPPQPQPHQRPNRRPRPPNFNPPPPRQRRNPRPPLNYPPIDSPISHRFSAPDEDEEEDWMMGSPLGRTNPNIPLPPPPQRQTPPGRGGAGSLEGRMGERKNQARVDEDIEDA